MVRLSVVLSLLLLAVSSAFAQTATDPQALTFLTRSLAAMRNGASAQAITDITLTGTARRIAGSDDETGTATLKVTADGQSSVELSFASGVRKEVRSKFDNGFPKGSWSGPDGKVHATALHNLMADATSVAPMLMLARIAASANPLIVYVGQETKNGNSVIHLSAQQQSANLSKLQPLSQTEIFLDATTLLPAAVSFNVHPDDDMNTNVAAEIRFSDYRPVNDVLLPFHVQRFLNYSLVLDLQFQSAVLNSGSLQLISNFSRTRKRSLRCASAAAWYCLV
jgi:hypothetical protein